MSTRYGCSIGTYPAAARLRLLLLFFSPGLTRMTRANNERPARTSFARWTKTVSLAVNCSRQSTRASPGESGGRTRRRPAGLGDEPEAIARELGLRPVASGTRRCRCACRPAGDRRLRSTPRTGARSSPARIPTARWACRVGRVPAAHDCGDAASSRVLGRRSSAGPTDCRRQGARCRRHSRSPGRDHRVDGRSRCHDERRSPLALRSSGALAGHPQRMNRSNQCRYAPSISTSDNARPPCGGDRACAILRHETPISGHRESVLAGIEP